MTTYDIAMRMDGPELINALRDLGVEEYHLNCITSTNNITLARALYVFVHMEALSV